MKGRGARAELTPAAPWCYAGAGALTCDLEPGHEGDHVAHGHDGRVCGTWSDDEGTDGPGGVPLELEPARELVDHVPGWPRAPRAARVVRSSSYAGLAAVRVRLGAPAVLGVPGDNR